MLAAVLLLNGPIVVLNDAEGETNNSRITCTCSNGEKSENKSMHDTLRDLMEQMKSHLSNIRQEYGTPHDVSLLQ
jgi:hypothetical protein